MCRIFGFRSVLRSRVHRSLIGADKSLSTLSEFHADGWGVAYYVGDAPHLIKSAQTAMEDTLFHRISGVVTSEAVLAHVRKATHGNLNTLNSHPFQYGRWVFAHNGTVHGFGELRPQMLALVSEELRPFILGDTDSEVLFYALLTDMARRHPLHDSEYPIEAVADAAAVTARNVWALRPDFHPNQKSDGDPTCLTFVVSNGHIMLGHHGGRDIHLSTHKSRCSEREGCAFYGPACEARTTGNVNHFMLSSEPLLGENVWEALHLGQMVGVDRSMRLFDRPRPG